MNRAAVMDLAAALAQDGVAIARGVVPANAIARLRLVFAAEAQAGSRGFHVGQELGAMVGARGDLGSLAARYLGAGAKPVRILFFDKTSQSNWAVPWHQDRTIALAQRVEIDGYGPWSRKGGVPHVEPPVEILAAMLTLRVFVDDCGEDNGPLEVAKGSHRHGRVAAQDVAAIVRESEIAVGTGTAGDVLIMKALAIHGSKRAAAPNHRRVLHVDYADADLPAGLDWALGRS